MEHNLGHTPLGRLRCSPLLPPELPDHMGSLTTWAPRNYLGKRQQPGRSRPLEAICKATLALIKLQPHQKTLHYEAQP